MANFKVGDLVSTNDRLLWFVVSSKDLNGRYKIVRKSGKWEDYDAYEKDVSDFAMGWENSDTNVGYAKPEAISMVKEY